MFTGSLVALVTPMSENGEIDEKAFENLIERQIEHKTDALVICGTTGEAPTLSFDEKIFLIKKAIAVSSGRVPIIAGTGTNDTRQSLLLTQEAKAYGADAALIIVPYYNRPTPLGVLKHFEALSSAQLPLIAYTHPGRTGIHLSISTLIELTKIPNVIGVKETSGKLEIALELSMHTSVFAGDDVLTLPMMASGAKGIISLMANAIPREIKELSSLCEQKEFEEAKTLTQELLPLMKAVLLETNPQGIKYALSLMNLCSETLRLPLIPCDNTTKIEIEKALFNYQQNDLRQSPLDRLLAKRP